MKLEEVVVRAAKREELEQVAFIEASCFPQEEAGKLETFVKRFEVFPETFFLALINDKIVGMINGGCIDSETLPDEFYHNEHMHKSDGAYQTVFGLAVLAGYQNKGVASALMQHLIQVSRERGKKGMILICKDDLIPYYERFGYKSMGRSASVHGDAQWIDMILRF